MRRRCRLVLRTDPNHSSVYTYCDFCGQHAAFHWRETYPDLLLCQEHIGTYGLDQVLEEFVPGSLCGHEM